MRPVLLPTVRRLWRDRDVVQFGRGPSAVVLSGVDAGVRAVLDLLDGTRSLPQLEADAAQVGCPPDRLRQLVDVLTPAGLLRDAAHWPPSPPPVADAAEQERLRAEALACGLPVARRGDVHVAVLGAGRLGATFGALLATAGIGALTFHDAGTVRPQDTGPTGLALADVGRPRGVAAAERVHALAPSLAAGRLPHLAVLCPPDDVPVHELREAVPPETPHLLVTVHERGAVVGPFVLPRATACLACLDLTRTDLDPDWPALASQLAGPVAPPADVVLSAAVAAQAAAEVLALVDGVRAPATLDGTLHFSADHWRWRRRSWQPHPSCACTSLSSV